MVVVVVDNRLRQVTENQEVLVVVPDMKVQLLMILVELMVLVLVFLVKDIAAAQEEVLRILVLVAVVPVVLDFQDLLLHQV